MKFKCFFHYLVKNRTTIFASKEYSKSKMKIKQSTQMSDLSAKRSTS